MKYERVYLGTQHRTENSIYSPANTIIKLLNLIIKLIVVATTLDHLKKIVRRIKRIEVIYKEYGLV